jgi:transcriptional regulator with XRE-family HTH domain
MVNIEKFAERLNKVMDYYELSAAQFSEKIEVQRSSISHILSGRNKPSLDFVLKVLKTFPEVELYWLLNGVGKFPKEIESMNNTASPLPKFEDDITIKEKNVQEPSFSKEIDRVVIFFKDGTFKNYKN